MVVGSKGSVQPPKSAPTRREYTDREDKKRKIQVPPEIQETTPRTFSTVKVGEVAEASDRGTDERASHGSGREHKCFEYHVQPDIGLNVAPGYAQNDCKIRKFEVIYVKRFSRRCNVMSYVMNALQSRTFEGWREILSGLE